MTTFQEYADEEVTNILGGNIVTLEDSVNEADRQSALLRYYTADPITKKEVYQPQYRDSNFSVDIQGLIEKHFHEMREHIYFLGILHADSAPGWYEYQGGFSSYLLGRPVIEHLESVINPAQRQLYVSQLDSIQGCLLYTSPSPRDRQKSRMPSSA